MVCVLAPSAVDGGFESWSGQTKDYKICMCCFSAKDTALRRKSKDKMARNQDNVSELGDIILYPEIENEATCLSSYCCFSDHIYFLHSQRKQRYGT